MNDEATLRAGEYVLGVLSPEEREAVERDAATDPDLAAEIAYWHERFVPLVETVDVEPPAELFDRIKKAIRADAADAADAQLPGTVTERAEELAGTVTVRAAEGQWERLARGIERKVLHSSSDGHITYLVRGQPGARLPGHDHSDDEEIFVLEGELTIGSVTLRAGDFHRARRGFSHPTATSATGCLLLVREAA
jgi:anti-sigma factor ChrR (cupin superfamily)